MTLAELKEKKICILGLGVNNQALAAYLLKHGCSLTIRDQNPELETSFTPPGKERITWEIQPDATSKLESFDVVFRTPGIPLTNLGIQKAKQKGVEISSQTKLFFDLCPARIIGVSGTKGKGTTCSLLHMMLSQGYNQGKSYVGGNIGVDPFSFLDELQANDLVVLELSSFQLEDLHTSPHVAVMLRVSSDHLEYHPGLAAYRKAKEPLLAYQTANDVAIINAEYAEMEPYLKLVKGTLYCYTRHSPARQSAWAEHIDGREVVFAQIGEQLESFDITDRKIMGDHNLENILPATLVGLYFKLKIADIRQAILEFSGLPHRLSLVLEANDVRFYNDSIATTPESSQVAMEAFPGKRIHLIAGGRDKGHEYGIIGEEIAKLCVSVSLLPGNSTARLRKAIEVGKRKHPENSLQILETDKEPIMQNILKEIEPLLKPGDIVLLAPVTRSDYPFDNYAERGTAFAEAVRNHFKKA